MDENRWAQAQRLFREALQQPAAERQAFLAAQCDDPALVAEVMALLSTATFARLREAHLAGDAITLPPDSPPRYPRERISPKTQSAKRSTRRREVEVESKRSERVGTTLSLPHSLLEKRPRPTLPKDAGHRHTLLWRAATALLLAVLLALSVRWITQQSDLPVYGVSPGEQGERLYSTGRWRAAEPFFFRAVTDGRAQYGDNHPLVAERLSRLGSLLQDLGNGAAAEQAVAEALHIRRQALGERHPDTAESLRQLGALLLQYGKAGRAEALLYKAHVRTLQSLGSNHPATDEVRSQLARAVQTRGDYATAERLFRQSLNARQNRLGADHPLTGVTMSHLAHLLSLKGESVEAEALFHQSLSVLHATLSFDDPAHALAEQQYGSLLASQSRFVEAEPLLIRAYEKLHARYGPHHPSGRDAAEALVAFYHALGKPDEALAYRRLMQTGSTQQ